MLPPATLNLENGSRTHFDSIWVRSGSLWATHSLDVSRCFCVSSFFSPCCSFCGKFAWGIPPDVSRCIRVWCQIVLKRTPLECRIPTVLQYLLWYMTSTRPLEYNIPAVLQSLWRYMAVYGCIWLHMGAYGRLCDCICELCWHLGLTLGSIWPLCWGRLNLLRELGHSRLFYTGIYGVWLHMVEYCVKAHGGKLGTPLALWHNLAPSTNQLNEQRIQRKGTVLNARSTEHNANQRNTNFWDALFTISAVLTRRTGADLFYWETFVKVSCFLGLPLVVVVVVFRRRPREAAPNLSSSSSVAYRGKQRQSTPQRRCTYLPANEKQIQQAASRNTTSQTAHPKLCYPSPAC
jgi:hypothetical protein